MGTIKDIFGKSKEQAEEMIDNEEKVEELIDEASEKAEEAKSSLKKVWHQLNMLISLLKDYLSGDYPYVSKRHILIIMAGLIYFILPLDFSPDYIPGIGYIDDAFVLSVIARQLISVTEEYETWKDNLTADDIPADE